MRFQYSGPVFASDGSDAPLVQNRSGQPSPSKSITPSPPGSVSTWYLRPAALLRSTKCNRAASAPLTIRIGGAAAPAALCASARRSHGPPRVPPASAIPARRISRLLIGIRFPVRIIFAARLELVGEPPRFRRRFRGLLIPAQVAENARLQRMQRPLLVGITSG